MRAHSLSLLVLLGVTPARAKDAPDAGAHAAPAASPRKLEPAEFKAALGKARASGKFSLLDVREPNETAGGYVQGAELLPYNSGVFAREHGKVPKDRPVLVYCASGRRAGRAAEMLVAEGWKDVTVLSNGGYADLRSDTGG
ncbi:MAG TPA: rhodanese-like domain-containing protein [Myxococcaceae bacterium]|nr:rhodanese-like domain-containing protein [Myxococcaceae bacterium]